MIQLRPYQETCKADIFNSWNSNFKNALLRVPTGGGKCLAKDTPILMYDGSIKLSQHVKTGDCLMGPDSKYRVVTSITSGHEEMFKVTPVKGDAHTFNRSHIMTLRCSFSEGKYQRGDLIDISINDYLGKSNNFKRQFKWTRTGVKFPKEVLEFDPYFVGLYLAEGTKRYNQITNPDGEVVKYLNDNFDIRTTDGLNHYIRTGGKGGVKSPISKLRTELCPMDGDRNIPKRYRINSKFDRLQMLAGLLDGDGYYHHGHYEIITKYKTLKDDILFLCRSLGMAAYSTIKIGKIKSRNFEGEYFRITISGELDSIPCKVRRKQATSRKQIKSVLNTGFKVESVGEGEYYGFEITGKDRRFLLGDFTITHNTVILTSLVSDTPHLTTAIMVHRKELVQQICLTLAREGIEHNIIASKKDIRGIIGAERRLFGRQLYNPNSRVTVISVDTLIARQHLYTHWFPTVQQWITDEAAHVLKENKWGKAISFFVNARGLGVTATPERLDKKGLGSHVDGVFDTMIEGPSTRWMIDNGFLSKYKIAIPPCDYTEHLKKSSSNADYSKAAMMQASGKSQITGDVVDNYIKFANGKQAILFASDVATAKIMEKKFLERGIKAKSLDGTTNDKERLESIIYFEEKKIQVLINVDLFDEGLDVPGIECVIMARPTKSLGKYLQMVGRGLRVADGKPHMILIDHVGNVMEHGLPCDNRIWTLDRIKRSGKKLNFMRICSNVTCCSPYDRALTECPWCDTPAVIANRSGGASGKMTLKEVDGDLFLIDPEEIRRLEAVAVLEDPGSVAQRVSMAVNPAAGLLAMERQGERIAMSKRLAQAIADWAGRMKTFYGYSDRQIHKKFYIEYGQTITEALGEPKANMEDLLNQLGERR